MGSRVADFYRSQHHFLSISSTFLFLSAAGFHLYCCILFMMGRLKAQADPFSFYVGLFYLHYIVRHLCLRRFVFICSLCVFASFAPLGRSYTNLLRGIANSNNMTCTYPTLTFN
jgi:hypothetical protein